MSLKYKSKIWLIPEDKFRNIIKESRDHIIMQWLIVDLNTVGILLLLKIE